MNGLSWFLTRRLPSTYLTVCYNEIQVSTKKGTSVWNFVLNSVLSNFRHDGSIVEICYQLSSTKVDAQSVINWTIVVGQLTVSPSSDSRPLAYHSDRQALSTARFRRAGLLAKYILELFLKYTVQLF